MYDLGSDCRTVRFERASKHGYRYYEVRVQPDLFGLVLIRVWGRRGSPMGGFITTPCHSVEHAHRMYRKVVKERERKDYRIVNPIA